MPPLWRTESFNSRKVLQWVARLGYWARGITYLAVGWLAILAVLSDTQTPTLKGAFTAIVEQPVGWLLLALLAGRLILHGVWRSIQAVLDLHGAGGGLKELTKRAGSLVSAALYAGLGLLAAADSVVLTLAAVSLHMLAMLATTGSVALLVYAGWAWRYCGVVGSISICCG
jgi:hypothetical protein